LCPFVFFPNLVQRTRNRTGASQARLSGENRASGWVPPDPMQKRERSKVYPTTNRSVLVAVVRPKSNPTARRSSSAPPVPPPSFRSFVKQALNKRGRPSRPAGTSAAPPGDYCGIGIGLSCGGRRRRAPFSFLGVAGKVVVTGR